MNADRWLCYPVGYTIFILLIFLFFRKDVQCTNLLACWRWNNKGVKINGIHMRASIAQFFTVSFTTVFEATLIHFVFWTMMRWKNSTSAFIILLWYEAKRRTNNRLHFVQHVTDDVNLNESHRWYVLALISE